MFVHLVLLYKRFICIIQYRVTHLLTCAFRELHWVSVAGILAPLKSMAVLPQLLCRQYFILQHIPLGVKEKIQMA